MQTHIRPIGREELTIIIKAASVIRHAYAQEAAHFGLTKHNCPTHPAFLPSRQLETMLASPRIHAFALFTQEEAPAGILVLRELPQARLEIVRVCVEPAMRAKGYGNALLRHAEKTARALGCGLLVANVAADNERVRAWYERQGYVQKGTLRFPNLPYILGFLEKELPGEEEEPCPS